MAMTICVKAPSNSKCCACGSKAGPTHLTVENSKRRYYCARCCPCAKKLMDGIWRCSCCGDMKDDATADARWRWNGTIWEHSHGQAGHYPARNFAEADT